MIYKIAVVVIGILELAALSVKLLADNVWGLVALARVRLLKSHDYQLWLKRDLADCQNILELGCGSNSPLLKIGLGKKTYAMDIWKPYVDEHNRKKDYRECWQGDILNGSLTAKGWDAVVILDVMEHLDREKALKIDLFSKMEKAARKKVIIFAPNGFIENDKVDGDPWQEHISAWQPSDYLERGYTVKGTTSVRYLLGKAAMPKFHPYLMCEILAVLSRPFVFDKPEWAWHSYAVKKL